MSDTLLGPLLHVCTDTHLHITPPPHTHTLHTPRVHASVCTHRKCFPKVTCLPPSLGSHHGLTGGMEREGIQGSGDCPLQLESVVKE